MLKYLKSISQLRSSADLVVLGNQSADMDSCCSALVTAFLQTETTSKKVVPLIQIYRQDFKLRRDVVYTFQKLGIDTDWLLFLDDLEFSTETNLFLVDHNSPTVRGKVVGIIDHHEVEDENANFKGCVPAKIVKCGSCMSAIITYFLDLSPKVTKLFQSDPILGPLAISPILQDTNNGTQKVEPDDIKALKFIQQHKNFSVFSPVSNFAIIKSEKQNFEGFSCMELLRKDYKRWGTIGISSLPKLFEKLAKKGYDLQNGLTEFRKQQRLDVMVALASGTEGKDNKYIRQLAICGPQGFNIADECPSLDLRLQSVSPNGVKFYEQRNTAASRKQIAPVIRKAFAMHSQVR